MSACDRCTKPGHCCTGMLINAGDWPLGCLLPLEVYVELARHFDVVDERIGSAQPLMPLWRRPDGVWRFWCPALTRSGRCGDYENRPGMCIGYAPMTDHLCHLGPYLPDAPTVEGDTNGSAPRHGVAEGDPGMPADR